MGIISALGRVGNPRQNVAFLFPDPGDSYVLNKKNQKPRPREEAFVFQYWPEAITDSDSTNYVEKQIPGASHPLYQWVGGGERSLSFDAIFTEEVEISVSLESTAQQNRILETPSERYSVDVAAAIAKLRQYLYPHYRQQSNNSIAEAPKKLILVLPGANLGHDSDAVPVILKSLNVNIESSFPSGRIRVATVSLSFAEIVQRGNGERASISYVDRDRMAGKNKRASKYDYRHGNYVSSISA